MKKYDIRLANSGDQEDILRLARNYHATSKDKDRPYDKQVVREQVFRAGISDSLMRLYVAVSKESSQCVGFCLLTAGSNGYNRIPDASLDMIYLEPMARAGKLGGDIVLDFIDKLTAFGKETGCGRIFMRMGVVMNNKHGERLFKKLGFNFTEWGVNATLDLEE